MLFAWTAIYGDETTLDQYPSEGPPNTYLNIDRSKLVGFILYNIATKTPHVVLRLQPGQKLIYRRRHCKDVYLSQGQEKNWDIHIVGFHELRNGSNNQQLAFVFPDGRVELMDRFRADVQWFRPFTLMKEEL